MHRCAAAARRARKEGEGKKISSPFCEKRSCAACGAGFVVEGEGQHFLTTCAWERLSRSHSCHPLAACWPCLIPLAAMRAASQDFHTPCGAADSLPSLPRDPAACPTSAPVAPGTSSPLPSLDGVDACPCTGAAPRRAAPLMLMNVPLSSRLI